MRYTLSLLVAFTFAMSSAFAIDVLGNDPLFAHTAHYTVNAETNAPRVKVNRIRPITLGVSIGTLTTALLFTGAGVYQTREMERAYSNYTTLPLGSDFNVEWWKVEDAAKYANVSYALGITSGLISVGFFVWYLFTPPIAEIADGAAFHVHPSHAHDAGLALTLTY